jgi:TatA/E family protein of Tat protein translocase
MLSLSPIKIMLIVTVVMVLLGPDKLPEVARRVGTAWKGFKTLQDKVEREVRSALPDLPSTDDVTRMVRSPMQLLNHLATQSETRDSSSETFGGVAASEQRVRPSIPTLVANSHRTREDEILLPDSSLN